jgi:hypothetical protein
MLLRRKKRQEQRNVREGILPETRAAPREPQVTSYQSHHQRKNCRRGHIFLIDARTRRSYFFLFSFLSCSEFSLWSLILSHTSTRVSRTSLSSTLYAFYLLVLCYTSSYILSILAVRFSDGRINFLSFSILQNICCH